ncbi:MAG: triose-phosphate isomerase [bacterium]|nr:triose-phosphate isomerase [bacterium]
MKKIVVANWKMNPATPREAKVLWSKTKALTARLKDSYLIVCPPAVFINTFSSQLTPRLSLGVQDISLAAGEGAFTGELSAQMLQYAGAQFALIGHSERRVKGETDEEVNKKVKLALASRLKPIICVGENKRDEHGHYLEPLRQQVKKALTGLTKPDLKRIIIAYEPVWAVGRMAKGADTPAEFLHHSLFIRKTLSDLFDKKLAMQVPIIYGGSVDSKNAEGFIKEGGADGLLVGRASLKPEEFKKILYVAEH